MENKNSNRNIYILLALLVGAILIGGYFWTQNQASEMEVEELNTEIGILEGEREDLLTDVQRMTDDYNRIVASNDSLQNAYAEQMAVVEKKEAEIKKIKKSAAKSAEILKEEIEQLKKIKSDLIGLVEELKNENAQLLFDNTELAQQVANSDEKVSALLFEIEELKQINAQLERDRAKLMATSARTSNIRVDITKRDDKPTTSHRRARQLTVSFNVANLPESRKGKKNLYVVIKNAQNIPVKVDNPVKATIRPEGGQIEEIIAQQMVTMDLNEKNRYQIKVSPQVGSLKKGYYRAVIYADWGLLGGAQFQLR